jgi:rubrerythrin
MMSKIPIELANVKPGDIDLEILRAAVIAELDAISLYEQMAATSTNPAVKAVLLDIAKEEKTHMGEFTTLLLRLDGEQAAELKNGAKEVEELLE